MARRTRSGNGGRSVGEETCRRQRSGEGKTYTSDEDLDNAAMLEAEDVGEAIGPCCCKGGCCAIPVLEASLGRGKGVVQFGKYTIDGCAGAAGNCED